ncbi:uncharacterized protein RCC_05989 [Ramularia collo-cygni]|uniref:Uncharacterized protein n=1 Tax=Ramularia collo-cygni TaxID=112498 RepID=A0A2D3US70_9PEZI|nr:uncharacterized protein RCC_05989 [Ramularia collo-cygni]CZT20132.1 uncharacterized protein RCC_05989 [Ramularia collo-cygni]
MTSHPLEVTTNLIDVDSWTPFPYVERHPCPWPCQRDHNKPSKKPPVARSLQYREHSAWQLAQLAIKSFDGSHPLRHAQRAAIARWNALNLTSQLQPDTRALPGLAEIFNDLFFLGQLPPTAMSVGWGRYPGLLGWTAPSIGPADLERVWLNWASLYLRYSTYATSDTLLHKMAHAFLHRYSRPDGRTSVSMEPDVNMGFTGHGRA